MAALVVGQGPLGDAKLCTYLMLGEVSDLPGLSDPGTQGFEETLILAVPV
jgi:hypothetical protein